MACVSVAYHLDSKLQQAPYQLFRIVKKQAFTRFKMRFGQRVASPLPDFAGPQKNEDTDL
jgi:hypothetical protein